MIGYFASRPHYERHIAPIWWALEPNERGGTGTARSGRHGLRDNILTLVGSYADAVDVRVPCVYVEHGAGQSYRGDPNCRAHNYYHGGELPKNVVGVIGPNESVASSWGLPYVAAGCPALDSWHARRPERRHPLSNAKPVICFTFHWDAKRVCPEARSAFPHWAFGLPDIILAFRSHGFTIAGTAHPRDGGSRLAWWRKMGVVTFRSPDEVFQHADVLFADNTSLALEFASIGGRIAWMNTPLYRQDVNHGGRFWGWEAAGPAFNSPHDLGNFDLWTWLREDPHRAVRERIASEVYAHRDSNASVRAARFVAQLAQEL